MSDVIAKADPVINATGGTSTYDGNPHGGTATATGVKGEALTPVNVAYTVVAAPPRNAGDLLTSAPVNAGNYSVAARFAGDTNYNQKQSASASVIINKATPTVSVSFGSSPITYDGNPHPATATVAGVGGADLTSGHGTVTVTYTPGPGAPVNAGSYSASAHFQSSDSNYTDADSTVGASLTINKADPVITATGGTFVYDGNPHGGTATATGVNGEPLTPVNVAYTAVAAPPRNPGDLLTAAPVNAGTYAVAARYAGDANYNQKQSAAAALIINKATPTVSVSFASSPITYDGNPHPATATVTGVGGADLTSGHGTVTVTYTPGPGAPVNAGSYSASAHFQSSDSNYTDADSTMAASLTINKADPIVTASGGTFVYDGSPHGGTGTATGVNNEPLSPVNVAYTVVAAPPRNPGDLLSSAPVSAGTYSVAARYPAYELQPKAEHRGCP